MKTASLISLLAVLWTFGAAATAQAQSGRAVFRAGDWYVVRSAQNVAGVAACTGFHMGHPEAQLGKDSLMVKIPGEIKTVGVRFDNEPARAPRPAAKAELQAGGVILAGAEFEPLSRGKTLDLDVTTAQGRTRVALKLEGLAASLKNMAAGCPLTAATARAERKAQLAKERAIKEQCEPPALARMRAKGLDEWRIAAKCPQAGPAPR